MYRASVRKLWLTWSQLATNGKIQQPCGYNGWSLPVLHTKNPGKSRDL